MKVKGTIILTFFILSGINSIAQRLDSIRREKTICLLTGVSYSDHTFVDLGIARKANVVGAAHPATGTYFAAGEFHFLDKPVVGPKVGFWMSGGLALGVNLIYYTDFSEGQLAFRPEIGIGFNRMKATYGYNARLTNTSFNRIAKNMFSLVYCFEFKKLNANIQK